MRGSSTVLSRPRVVIKRRKGLLVAAPQGGPRPWRVLIECLAMLGLSCTIIACGAVVGFYSERSAFNAQGQQYAEGAMRAAIVRWNTEALQPRPVVGSLADRPYSPRVFKGCFGQSQLQLFNPGGLIFARYVCEAGADKGMIVANMVLRRDPDDWKIASLYVSPQPPPSGKPRPS